MRSLLLFFALVLVGCYAASLAPDPLGHFAARTDHLHRLEPLGERILHGAALSYGPLDHEERTRPLFYAVYYELHDLPYDWHMALLANLDQHVGYGLPQIDLGFNSAGQPYEAAIAEGQLDEAIEQLCWGLQQLDRPVLLRLGYAFKSSWRAYDATSYTEAWRRIAQTLRGRWGLDHVALVWTQKDDGGPDYLAYYPGDEYVDWWSIDVAAPQDLRRSRAFIEAAQERGYPVLVGVVTPVTTDLEPGRAGVAPLVHPLPPLLAPPPQHQGIYLYRLGLVAGGALCRSHTLRALPQRVDAPDLPTRGLARRVALEPKSRSLARERM